MFVFVRSLSFLCPLWSLSLESQSVGTPLVPSGLEHLATYRTGDRNHRAVVHVDTRGVAICLERDNPRSAKSSVRHDLQIEAWNASNLTATNFQKYQIKLLVFEHFFQEN